MATFKLRLKYDLDLARCAEIAQRVKDFSVPFANIIMEWAANNAGKFGAGKGAELSGASGGDLTPATWEPLQSLSYVRQKRKQGFADWLMVRTGELMHSLIDLGGFSQFVDAHRVVFGTPLSADDADKALYNSDRRPTVFLSETDRLMVRRELQRYISFGEGYRNFLFNRAAERWAQKKELSEMDLKFAEAISG
jgi:hypothetical protein